MTARTRRSFLTDVAIAGAGLTIVPRHVLGRGFTAPSDVLNVAAVGVGGQGRADLVNLASENVVALCDVDWDYGGKAFESLATDIRNQQERLDRTTPRLDAQGRPETPLTATDRERMAMQIDRMKRLKDEHLPRATRYRTTVRCSIGRKTSTPSSSLRPITCTRRSPWRRWTSASTSTCRSR